MMFAGPVLLGQAQPITSFLQKHPRLVATSVALSFATRLAVSNYHDYLAMGPGGLPYNAYGWLIALSFRIFSRAKFSTEEYDQDGNKESFLGDEEVKERRGERPKLGWHVVPSRQLDRHPPPGMGERLIAVFDKLAEVNRDLVDLVPSRLEHIHPAHVMKESLPTPHVAAKKARREICHIHRHKDFSVHIVMSPQDCKTVIAKGWGERHAMSGTFMLPKEYLLLYAARDDEELAMIARCMRAAIGYMANTHAVKGCDI